MQEQAWKQRYDEMCEVNKDRTERIVGMEKMELVADIEFKYKQKFNLLHEENTMLQNQVMSLQQKLD